MTSERMLVVGAGQGGHAIAAYAALQGHPVTLHTHTPVKAERFAAQHNTIEVSGKINDVAQLERVTTDLEDALHEQDVIVLCTDATVHDYYAKLMAPHLSDERVVLISPGVGGAMAFSHKVSSINPSSQISVAETDTLMYACKTPQTAHSHIKDIKQSVLYTSVPNDPSLQHFWEGLYPQFEYIDHPLMGLDDSPVFHIVGMLMNAGRILNKEDFNFYIDGITPELANLMEDMDAERYDVAQAVGLEPRTITEWLHNAYGVPPGDLYSMIQQTPAYQNTPEVPNRSPAPKTLFHRYVLEEIPLRAVPTVRIAELLGIETPIYRDMVDRAYGLTGINFWKSGRNLEDMGLDAADVMNYGRR